MADSAGSTSIAPGVLLAGVGFYLGLGIFALSLLRMGLRARLLERFWWGSVFLLNLPIVAVALAVGWFLLPESRDPDPPRPDVPGLVLSVAALSSLVYGIIEAPSSGWTSVWVIGALTIAVVSGAAFVVHEARTDQPMLDLRLFRNPRLARGTAAVTLAGLAIVGSRSSSPSTCSSCRATRRCRQGSGSFRSRSASGSPARSASASCLERVRVARWPLPSRLLPCSLVALSRVGPGTSYWIVAGVLLTIGLGIGAAFVPATDSVMAGGSRSQRRPRLGAQRLGSTGRRRARDRDRDPRGDLQRSLRVGIAGIAATLDPRAAEPVKASVGGALEVASGIGGSIGLGLREAAVASFMDGFRVAMLVGAALLGVGAVLVLRYLPSRDVEPQPDIVSQQELVPASQG